MDGVSDYALRQICREWGADISFTPFLSADKIISKDPVTLAEIRQGEPVIVQLFGSRADQVCHAAEIALERGARQIDLNMGCSARRIVHKGCGAALLSNIPVACQILESLVKRLPSSVPVSAKIRLGTEKPEFREFIDRLAETGIRMLSVHGRTRSQGYSGQADWEAIAWIKARVKLTVFGSGDISSPADIENRKACGLDGLLIGRGAIGNPWIFSGRTVQDLTPGQWFSTMKRHLELMREEGPCALLFRKHLARYCAHLDSKERGELLRCEDPLRLLEDIASRGLARAG